MPSAPPERAMERAVDADARLYPLPRLYLYPPPPSSVPVCGRTQPGVPYGEYTFPKNVYGDEMLAPPVVAKYLEGEEIAVGFSVTTHHYGHVEARVCCDFRPGEDTNGTQACFDAGELAFVRDELYDAPPDLAYPGRGHLAPLEFSEVGHAAGNNFRNDGSEDLGGMPFHHTFRLPRGVYGDRCVLQWIYVTSQNCESPGYEAYEWPSGSWRQRGADHFRCPDPPSRDGSGYPERFWNCADVKIVPADPGVLAAKRFLEPVVDALEVGAAFFSYANRTTCAGPELDTADASGNTCRSFKDWGKCDEAWIVDGGFCERTCGRCRDPTDPDDPLFNLTRVQTTKSVAASGGAPAAAGWGDILGRR